MHLQGLSPRLLAFIACSTAASLADAGIRFGVSWFVLQSTGSAALFTSVYGMSVLADAFARPLLAPLGDYFNRMTVFKWAALLATVLSAGLALAVAFLPFSPVALAVLLVALGLVTGLREPTSSALLAELAQPHELVKAQSLQLSAATTVAVLGMGVAGGLVAYFGPLTALAASAAFEAVGWAGAALLPRFRKELATADHPSARSTWSEYRATVFQRIADGLRCLWRASAERNVIFAGMFTNAAMLCLMTLVMPVWVSKDLQGDARLMAGLEMSFALGFLAGAAVAVSAANRLFGRSRAAVIGPLVSAAAFGLASSTAWPPALFILLALAGMGFPLFTVNCGSVRALATPDRYRTRMMGAAGFVVGGLLPLAVPGLGVLMQRMSGFAGVAFCGVCMAVAALLIARNRESQALLKLPPEQVVNAYERMYPHAFPEPPRSA